MSGCNLHRVYQDKPGYDHVLLISVALSSSQLITDLPHDTIFLRFMKVILEKNTAKRHIRPLYMLLFFLCFSHLRIIGWCPLYFFGEVIFNYWIWSSLFIGLGRLHFFGEVVFIFFVGSSSFFWWDSLNFFFGEVVYIFSVMLSSFLKS